MCHFPLGVHFNRSAMFFVVVVVFISFADFTIIASHIHTAKPICSNAIDPNTHTTPYVSLLFACILHRQPSARVQIFIFHFFFYFVSVLYNFYLNAIVSSVLLFGETIAIYVVAVVGGVGVVVR